MVKKLAKLTGICLLAFSLILTFNPSLARAEEEITATHVPAKVKDAILALPLEPFEFVSLADGTPISSVREGILKYFEEAYSKGVWSEVREGAILAMLKNIAKLTPKTRKDLALLLNAFPYDTGLPSVMFKEFMDPGIVKLIDMSGGFTLAGIASCFTGHYGGFMEPIMPMLMSLLPVLMVMPVTDPSKLKIFIRDNRSDPALQLQAMESFKTVKFKAPVLLTWDPETSLAAGPLWEKYNWVNPAIGSGGLCTTYTFGNQWCVGQCIHDEEMADYVRYFTMEYPKQTGNPYPRKYGYLIPNIEFYRSCQEGCYNSLFFRQISNEYGLEFVGGESFSMTVTDVTPQLTRLRDKGIEVITGLGVGGEGAVAVKSARSLGMLPKTKLCFWGYAGMGDAGKIVGLKNMEGAYAMTTGGNSIDDPDQRGVKESRLIFTNIAGYKLFTGCNSAMCLRIADGAFVGAIIGPLKEITTWKEFEEEDFEAIQTKMAEHPELLLGAAERGIFEKENHKYSAIEGGPLLYLPGKISQQHSQIWQWQEGKYGMGMYDVQRQNGSHWDWVPPNVISVTNPTAPRGVPIPFEGSIDYGPPFGEWNLDMFFKEYQDESYLWEHDDNLVPEFYPKGTREGIPLWWFIFQYGFNDEGKLDKAMLYKALDKYFALKGRTGDEARAELSKFMELYYLPDHWVEWLSEYEVEG